MYINIASNIFYVFCLILLRFNVTLGVIMVYINCILDVKSCKGAGHYLTSECTQFYLQWYICTIIVYICVYNK